VNASVSDVITRIEGAVGRITLNRPAALHALTTAMCQAMIEALAGWRHEPAVDAVLIDHAGERGFCAGGDIRMLAESGAGDGKAAREFFFTEYRLNALLQAYEKPIVVVMDGVTMGGGVGIALPAQVRIATERTTFAMPESGIGLFPDVGGGWWLPRLPGQTGLWLALTGARLKGADCLALGIATHFVESGKLDRLKSEITSAERIEVALEPCASSPGPPPIEASRADIDRLFSGESVEAIFAALAADGSDWATTQLDALKTKSPQTLKVAFRELRDGASKTRFADEMAVEYRIGARVVRSHDFIEGVRAVIVEKDNAPRWDPPDLAGVTAARIDEIFSALPPDEEWTPLGD
jgi:enoyl-CoA hydratase